VSVADLAGESRWPDWVERALDAGAHSCLSIGLPLRDGVAGALTVYSTKPDAFDQDAVVLAETFAGYAAMAMANAHRDGNPTNLTAHLRAAADGRAVIEQAKGIVMVERGCPAPEAFAVLAEIARYSCRPVGDVAAAVVASAVQTPTGMTDAPSSAR
jgi:GAF domain-containing protein